MHAYEADDEHVLETRRAASMLRLVPALPPPPAMVLELRNNRAWARQSIAPVRHAACLASWALHAAAQAHTQTQDRARAQAQEPTAPTPIAADPAATVLDRSLSFSRHALPFDVAPASVALHVPAPSYHDWDDAGSVFDERVAAASDAQLAVDIDDDESVLSLGDDAVVVDISGMAVALHAPELPVIDREVDVIEYTRAVVAAAFEDVAAA